MYNIDTTRKALVENNVIKFNVIASAKDIKVEQKIRSTNELKNIQEIIPVAQQETTNILFEIY